MHRGMAWLIAFIVLFVVGTERPRDPIWTHVVIIGCCVVLVYMGIRYARGKLKITDGQVIVVGPIRSTTIPISSIEGVDTDFAGVVGSIWVPVLELREGRRVRLTPFTYFSEASAIDGGSTILKAIDHMRA